jgi:hypothetical protein
LGTKLLGSIYGGKKDLYHYKNVFGRVAEPFIGSKDLDEVPLMDIQKLVLATTPHQARHVSTYQPKIGCLHEIPYLDDLDSSVYDTPQATLSE